MSTIKVRIITCALVALLTASCVQPMMAHACSSMLMGNDTDFPAALSASNMDDACSFMQVAEDHCATAAPDASGHDTTSQMPAGKLCTMKACFQVHSPLVAQHYEFFIIPAKAEIIAHQSDTCIPSSHLSGLFRPPRLNTTHWG